MMNIKTIKKLLKNKFALSVVSLIICEGVVRVHSKANHVYSRAVTSLVVMF